MTHKVQCVVRACPRDVAVKKHGLCIAHYRRWQRKGDVGGADILERRRVPKFRGGRRRRRVPK